MDYHQLQKKLFEIEPTDPVAERAALEAAASGSAPPPQREERVHIGESAPSPKREAPSDEAAQLAALAGIEPSNKQPVTGEAAELAALAGITEGYKKGKSGQLKGTDKVSKSSPSKSGEQKNVTRGKLVGSTENDDESIEEGPRTDQMKKDWAAGKKDYNNVKAVTGALGNNKKKDDKGKDSSKTKSNSSNSQLSPELSKLLAKYETALIKISNDKELGKEFKRFMQRAENKKESIGESANTLPPHLEKSLSRHVTALSRIERTPELKEKFDRLMGLANPTSQYEQFDESLKGYKQPVNEGAKESIKSELLRKLNSRR
jgi:hypothetical protein